MSVFRSVLNGSVNWYVAKCIQYKSKNSQVLAVISNNKLYGENISHFIFLKMGIIALNESTECFSISV